MNISRGIISTAILALIGLAIVIGAGVHVVKTNVQRAPKIQDEEKVSTKSEDALQLDTKKDQENPIFDTTKPPEAETSNTGGVPSIRLLSPNGGEVLKANESYTFLWETKDTPEGATISAALVDSEKINTYILSDVENTGQAKITIPPGIISGEYNIRIFCSTPNSERYCSLENIRVEDFSDDTVTVVGNKPPTISLFKGPTRFFNNEPARWYISASDPNDDPLTVYIRWGDGQDNAYEISTGKVQQFFSHTYNTEDRFVTISVEVTDIHGESVSARESTIIQYPTDEARITLEEPYGGEVFYTGDTIEISWKSFKYPSGVPITIHLREQHINSNGIKSMKEVDVISDGTDNDGSYFWKIPRSVSAGESYFIGMGCGGLETSNPFKDGCRPDNAYIPFTIK